MEVTRKNLPKSQVELTIQVSMEEMSDYVQKTLGSLGCDITVPGFRKGEAPQDLVRKHVGAATLLAHALDHAVNESYRQAIIQEKLNPLAQAQVELGEKQDETGLEYTAKISIMPEIDLPDYQKIAKQIKQEAVSVEDKDLEEAKQYLRKSRGKQTAVDRKAKKDDIVTIDYTLTQADKEVDTSTDMPVTIGEGRFIPGFEEELIGLAAEDTKQFEITFPKDYHNTDLAGKVGVFKVTVKKVEEVTLPEWNDDFAKELTNGHTTTVADLEKSLREGLESEKQKEVETAHKQAIMDGIMAKVKVELPEVLIDSEKDRILQEMEQRAVYSGETLDQSLERAGKSREDIKSEISPQAESRVLLMILLRKIADAEGLRANDEEVATQMTSILARYPKDQAKEMDQSRLRLMVEGEMLDKLTLDYLASLSEDKK